MKKLILIIVIFTSFFPIGLYSQTDVDALRYSMINFGGTARYSSMCGAFGAIGADFSVLSTNPAGLAAYRKSEYTFTPAIYSSKTNSDYNGTKSDDTKYNFNISNFGMVYAINEDKNNNKSGWKFVNIGFGLNRYNNFHNRIDIEGNNNQSSLMDLYLNAAQRKTVNNLDDFSTKLAFNTYLLDTINSTNYFSNVPKENLFQRKGIETTGKMEEYVFSVAANYNNKFYIGGTIGIPQIKYFESSTYSEHNHADSTIGFNNFTFNNDLKTTGTGYNFKFGLIYVPVDIDLLKVKIGAAIHSPTFFSLHDEYSAGMTSDFNTITHSSNSPQGSFDYELTSPMRAIGSLAIQIGKYCTLSADYEFVDYSETRIHSTDKINDQKINDNIQSKYRTQHNIRLGGEVVVGLCSIRGGYAIYGSPYKSGINDGSITAMSIGFGFIEKNYFIDFGYVNTQSKSDYYLYNLNTMTPAKNKIITNNFIMTFGLKF